MQSPVLFSCNFVKSIADAFRGYSCLLTVLLLLTTTLQAQDLATDRNRKWNEDISFLAEELPKRHKNLFFELEVQEFQRSVETARNNVSQRNDNEIQLALARLVASVGDGHTSVSLDSSSFEFLPFRAGLFKDGLFLTMVSEGHEEYLGSRLLAINGRDVAGLFDALAPLIAHDNQSYLKQVVPTYLHIATILDFVGVTDPKTPILLTVEHKGQQSEFTVIRQTRKQTGEQLWVTSKQAQALFEKKENLDYWTEWLPDSKTFYVKYRRCKGMLTFALLSAEIVKFLEENEVERIVIDMRLNGGGSSIVMQPLIAAMKESELNNRQQLFVIVGRRTFSSAVLNAIDFKQQTNATLVGLPTGGKPNHYGEVKAMSLPNSGLRVSYSTNYFHHYRDGDPDSIEPDVKIGPSFEDWKNGKDAVMRFILEQPTR